jgi:hypothetical protein
MIAPPTIVSAAPDAPAVAVGVASGVTVAVAVFVTLGSASASSAGGASFALACQIRPTTMISAVMAMAAHVRVS